LQGKLLTSDSCSETSAEHIELENSEDESSKKNATKKRLRLAGFSSE